MADKMYSLVLPLSLWISLEIPITNAIVTKQVQYPLAAGSTPPGASSYNPGQIIGILTGPHPSWSSPGGTDISWNNYLNAECQADNDCYPGRTLLYCISNRCKCITQGATYLNGYFYNYNMEWNETLSQCVSQSGSPCTLKQFWYSSDTLRMNCIYDHDCVEISSSPARATLASQNPMGFGSTVSGPQVSGYHRSNHHEQSHFLQYFGSGVVGFGGFSNPNQYQQVRGQDPPPNHDTTAFASSSSVSSTSSSNEKNTWGICVKKSFVGSFLPNTNANELNSSSSQVGLQSMNASYLCLLYASLVLINLSRLTVL